MLNCVFWRHILLEIEFKSRVDMGSESQIAFGYGTAVSPMSGKVLRLAGRSGSVHEMDPCTVTIRQARTV